MKKMVLILVLISILVLSGCTPTDAEEARKLADDVREVAGTVDTEPRELTECETISLADVESVFGSAQFLSGMVVEKKGVRSESCLFMADGKPINILLWNKATQQDAIDAMESVIYDKEEYAVEKVGDANTYYRFRVLNFVTGKYWVQITKSEAKARMMADKIIQKLG